MDLPTVTWVDDFSDKFGKGQTYPPRNNSRKGAKIAPVGNCTVPPKKQKPLSPAEQLREEVQLMSQELDEIMDKRERELIKIRAAQIRAEQASRRRLSEVDHLYSRFQKLTV